MLTKLDLLFPNNQYAEIKVAEKNRGAKKIKANFRNKEEEDNKSMVLKATLIYLSTSCKAISLKSDYQELIIVIHNLVYHAQTKYINISHHYIYDKVATRQINLQYILINKIIVDGLTKAFTHTKFCTFVKQMNIN